MLARRRIIGQRRHGNENTRLHLLLVVVVASSSWLGWLLGWLLAVDTFFVVSLFTFCQSLLFLLVWYGMVLENY